MPLSRKPTAIEQLVLCKSRDLTVLVGEDEKAVIVPGDLLCCFSPVLKDHITGDPAQPLEGVTMDQETYTLRLPHDRPEFFETLRDYIVQGDSLFYPDDPTISYFVEYLRFCDKYDVLEAAGMIADSLEHFLQKSGDGKVPEQLDKSCNDLVRFAMIKLWHPLPSVESLVKLIEDTVSWWLLREDSERLVAAIINHLPLTAQARFFKNFFRCTVAKDGARVPREY